MSGSFRNPLMLFLRETVSSTLFFFEGKKFLRNIFWLRVLWHHTGFLFMRFDGVEDKQTGDIPWDGCHRGKRGPTSNICRVCCVLASLTVSRKTRTASLSPYVSRSPEPWSGGGGVGCLDQDHMMTGYTEAFCKAIVKDQTTGVASRAWNGELWSPVSLCRLPTNNPSTVIYRALDNNPNVTKVLYNKIKKNLLRHTVKSLEYNVVALLGY